MYNKYIVLKKTGAALPLWLQTGRAESSLKGGKAEPTLPLNPRPLFFFDGVPIFPNPLALPCVKTAFFEISVFPPTQTGRKKEISPNSETPNPRTTK